MEEKQGDEPVLNGPGLAAVIWDFDGTISDSRERNLDVIRSIMSALGKDPDSNAYLSDKYIYTDTLLAYQDWRDFYLVNLGMTLAETAKAGGMWGEYQLRSSAPLELYPGVGDAIRTLDLPQAIFSINSQANIIDFLKRHELENYFGAVIGYEQLKGAGKPDPEGIIHCLHKLGMLRMKAGTVLYIGDHKTDIETSNKANHLFRAVDRQVSVKSVLTTYINKDEESKLDGLIPDHIAKSPSDIVRLAAAYKTDSFPR